ncbi:MAG: class I SAM-dependent methyltransferase [Candidatus Nanopelagicales bacterium]
MDHPQVADASRVQIALARRSDTRIAAEGKITFPAVPSLVDRYTEKCARIFAELGRAFTDPELAQLRSALAGQLAGAYSRSQRSSVEVSYATHVAQGLSYQVGSRCMTLEEAYHDWIATREPPLFGTEPDARVWALAGAASDPRTFRILDIGGGTGRNALALARRGHPVDVVELTEKFADSIRADAARESLDVRVIQCDVFEAEGELRQDYSLILLSEVVPEFRTTDKLRHLFELASRCLAPDGVLVFNVFLADAGYTPDDAARQFAQQAYSAFFTRPELATAVAGLPLELVADDCVYEYEQANLPDGAWPPTNWYVGWISGRDVFGLEHGECPIDFRWLVYRKA